MLESTRDELLADPETIVAIATPEGRSAIGVVRVSGPDTLRLTDSLFRSRAPCLPRQARYGAFGPPGGPVLDRVIVTVFPRPGSYTGEDSAEIVAHGNPLILNKIEAELVSAGARRARPGEFTLRAVSNGKMDLSQAEAVRDFVAAQTEEQARNARALLDGAVGERLEEERRELVGLVAELEAGIDFADDDIAPPDPAGLSVGCARLGRRLSGLAATFGYGRILTEGLKLTIAGRPNVGKSSLFNRLIAQDRAIVTEVAGTTRDVLTETIAVSGVPVRIADTAGFRETTETVEGLGVERSLAAVAGADLTLLVLDGSEDLRPEDTELLSRFRDLEVIHVVNKGDRPGRWERTLGPRQVRISALEGTGLEILEGVIGDWIARRRAVLDGFAITSDRQRRALELAADLLGDAAGALESALPTEMVLVDLYRALSALGEVTGEVTSEDILDEIFATFCVGK